MDVIRDYSLRSSLGHIPLSAVLLGTAALRCIACARWCGIGRGACAVKETRQRRRRHALLSHLWRSPLQRDPIPLPWHSTTASRLGNQRRTPLSSSSRLRIWEHYERFFLNTETPMLIPRVPRSSDDIAMQPSSPISD